MIKAAVSQSCAARCLRHSELTPPHSKKELLQHTPGSGNARRLTMADLDTLLATAPAGSKDASQKQAHADQVFAALDKIADSKIDLTIDAMTPDAGDVLLKYVYKGLETPSERTPSLLKWQAKLAEKFGVGSIVRVLSDRKTV